MSNYSFPNLNVPRRIVAELDALKRLQAETPVKDTGQAATELDAFPPPPRLRWTGLPALLDRAFKGEL